MDFFVEFNHSCLNSKSETIYFKCEKMPLSVFTWGNFYCPSLPIEISVVKEKKFCYTLANIVVFIGSACKKHFEVSQWLWQCNTFSFLKNNLSVCFRAFEIKHR